MKIENTSLSLNNLNEEVNLFGWVSKVRNLGGLLFIDLRDRSGIIQLVVRPDNEYYNARFMNNQSLDTVIYGNDPMNLDEKLENMIAGLEEEMNAPDDVME